MSTKVVPTSNTTMTVSQTDLATQNDQLWSIITKQRNVIKDLEQALANMTKDRDSLLLAKKQQPSPSQEPVPPPRSPYRQHHHTHDGSAIIPTISTTIANNTRYRSCSSITSALDSSTSNNSTLSSPIHAIMDKDAQLFAKYQQAIKKLDTTSTSSSSSFIKSDPLSSSPIEQQHPITRRAFSQPHLITSTNEQHAFFANISIKVLDTTIQKNLKGKEILSFIISIRGFTSSSSSSSILINPTSDDDDDDDELWRIKKVYSDFLALDTLLRSQYRSLSNHHASKMGKLPDKSLFTTHGQNNKMDNRKAIVEKYLTRAIRLSLPEMTDLVQFLSTDIIDQEGKPTNTTTSPPKPQKKGYLSLQDSRQEIWQPRFFILHGSVLDYYDTKGGLLIGSIQLSETHITMQQMQDAAQNSTSSSSLIITENKPTSTTLQQYTLCADSDIKLDEWAHALSPFTQPTPQVSQSTCTTTHSFTKPSMRHRVSKDQIKQLSAAPISPENHNNYGKFTTRKYIQPTSPHYHPQRSNSDTSIHPGEFDGGVRRASHTFYPHSPSMNDTQSLPSSSTVETYRNTLSATCTLPRRDHLRQRSSLDAIYYSNHRQQDNNQKQSISISTIPTKKNSPSCPSSPSSGKIPSTILGSIGDDPSYDSTTTTTKKKVKTKTSRRTFWPRKIFSGNHQHQQQNDMGVLRGFLSRHSSDDSSSASSASSTTQVSRTSTNHMDLFNSSSSTQCQDTPAPLCPVFGVPLEQAVRISKIDDNYELPAVVYRCIEFLETKDAIYEEGIYRLSGSAVKIKALRREFDEKGDVNLLTSEEHQDCDVHAISGLLKLWLRELPSNVLTQNLLKEFLPVIDMVDRDECINELGRLISMLPLANYTLLRALTAHLLRVVQNADTNKMTLRNIGIVFSPTLGIPTGIFNLFLCEFDYIFWTMEQQQKQHQQQKSATLFPSLETKPELLQEQRQKDNNTNPNNTQSSITDTIHPTQVISPTPRHSSWRRNSNGRSNRNSVQYSGGAPECIVGMERQCQKGTVDQEEEEDDDDDDNSSGQDIGDDNENSVSDDDDDDDDMDDFDNLPVHDIPHSIIETWKMTSRPVS
ncbi:uncharacterized protein BX664DRAFT_301325 [Halteromyces radiatus]|uniref:uncharacterized protein n=1 Tax=Halteromyces radiatus TaxID=101107 RepID=UPI00221EBF76|nr:uncharacterized protein BX664DRAFT_301325 [Halteromyces radiatus]KAI8082861.1 hypothetical protein BX664DRAFT_301325 [Halteromyces radiatus]